LNTEISNNYVRNTTLTTVRTDISSFKIDVSNNYARNSALTKYDVSLSALASQISSGGGSSGSGITRPEFDLSYYSLLEYVGNVQLNLEENYSTSNSIGLTYTTTLDLSNNYAKIRDVSNNYVKNSTFSSTISGINTAISNTVANINNSGYITLQYLNDNLYLTNADLYGWLATTNPDYYLNLTNNQTLTDRLSNYFTKTDISDNYVSNTVLSFFNYVQRGVANTFTALQTFNAGINVSGHSYVGDISGNFLIS
jgi:hypothetical protein